MILVFQKSGAVSDDACEGSPKIVGYGAEQIGAHLFHFGFGELLFSVGDHICLKRQMGRKSADKDCDCQHTNKSNGIIGNEKIVVKKVEHSKQRK